jgi:protease IV
MPEKRSNLLLWLVLGGGAFLFLCLLFVSLAVYYSRDRESSFRSFSLTSDQIAVLEVEGLIADSTNFVDQLKEYGERPSVKAVILRLNTPGGGVAASQEMFEAVKRFRSETGKKVVVSMASVAASGGYYLACGADRIFANPGTVTGSIGVIAEWYNYGELLKWAKTADIVIKSGPFKDAGSGTRPLKEEERAYLQNMVNNMYGQFVFAVASGRKMNEDVVRKLADGRVYTGLEAQANGLVDDIGTFQDAVEATAKMAGISGKPRLLKPPKAAVSLLDMLLGNSKSALSLIPDRSQSNIRFQYLWR